jgi:hypothetical protein
MQKQLKIVGLETDVLRFPPGQIYYDAIHEFGAASGAVVLRLKTDAGITGWATSSLGTMEGGSFKNHSSTIETLRKVNSAVLAAAESWNGERSAS